MNHDYTQKKKNDIIFLLELQRVDSWVRICDIT